MRFVLRLFLLIAIGAALTTCRRADGIAADPYAAEAERLLLDYLRIDTTNPPGNETRGAEFLLRQFRQAGIDARLIGSDPMRQSLYARLDAPTSTNALLLLHHIDVVPSDAESWSVPPFAGKTSGGYVWGRGALDSKSLGIAHLMAMLELKRSGAVLDRDVIFLAAADEEGGSRRGCEELLASHAELFAGVTEVLNEGGTNRTIVDYVSEWGIEVHQKVPLWLRLRVRGPSGHAALPPSDPTSIEVLADVIRDLGSIVTPRVVVPELARQMSMSRRAAIEDALTRDTIVVTSVHAGTTVNSLPREAVADVDCRLVPGSSPDVLLQRIRESIKSRAEVEVLLRDEGAPSSPIDTPLYRHLARELGRAEKKSAVVPTVIAGTTDSRFFRRRGIPAYGFSPFKVNYYDFNVHAVDERIRLSFFHEGVRLMRQVVRSYVTMPGTKKN